MQIYGTTIMQQMTASATILEAAGVFRPSSPLDATPQGLPRREPAVVLESIVKDYKTCRALDDISLSIPQGATVGFVGWNGAGKTTTIFTILGLVAPSSGKVSVFGHDMAREPYRVLHRMNFASPYMSMPARLSVRQNLLVFGHLYGLSDVKRRIAQLAHEFELGDILDRAVGTLSAGQKTRVSLAKALLNEPDLLLLDEPTASLDLDRANWVHQRIEAHRRRHGATVLLTSHNMVEVERLCDRVVVMRHGRIVEQGSTAELKYRYGAASLDEALLRI
jgi:ABC-2 type transport system ATP-binding protein